MDTDTTLLQQKIERLTDQVKRQGQRLEELAAGANGDDALHKKLDFIVSQLEAQQQRQAELDELKRDLLPIANHMIKLSIDELAEIGTEFQLEDLLFLLKRLLRDTHLLVGLLDRLESTVELVDDVQDIGNQAFHHAIVTLDRLEREGYFTFARGGWRLVERIVNEFGEEDIEALSDNIVTILTTVRNMTQPEILSMANNAIQAIQVPPAKIAAKIAGLGKPTGCI